MREEKIIEQLNLELNQRDSDVFHRIDWHGGYHPEESAPSIKKRPWWTLPNLAIGTLALAAIVLIAVVLTRQPTPESILYVDINPTFEIHVKSNQQVKSITSDSIEGETLLNEMGEVENESLEVVVNRLMEILDQQDYLSTPNNFLVVSTSDQEDTVLVEQVDKVIKDYQAKDIIVLHQEVDDEDEQLTSLSKQYGLSYSRMRFVLRVHEFYDAKSVDELSQLSINELIEYLDESDKKLSDFDRNLINISISRPEPEPTPEPTSVTREQALQIAYAHAGVNASDVRDLQIELDDGEWEIEFEVGNTEYEYDIRVSDGTITSYDIDVDDD